MVEILNHGVFLRHLLHEPGVLDLVCRSVVTHLLTHGLSLVWTGLGFASLTHASADVWIEAYHQYYIKVSLDNQV